MHQENGMPFKSFVSILMELLEDADGMVRDTARISVIELFKWVTVNIALTIANRF
jgi:CLIP-associating protein 1/2